MCDVCSCSIKFPPTQVPLFLQLVSCSSTSIWEDVGTEKEKREREKKASVGKAVKFACGDLPHSVAQTYFADFCRNLQKSAGSNNLSLDFSPWLKGVLVTGAVKSCCFSLWSSVEMTRRKFSSRDPSTRSESASLSNRWVIGFSCKMTHSHILTCLCL